MGIFEILILTSVYVILSIHSVWFLVRLYSRKHNTIPPDWMATTAAILPIVSHLATFLVFRQPNIEHDEIIEEDITYDNSHLSSKTGFKCNWSKQDIFVGSTILFEEQVGIRIATCEATVRLDDTHDGYYLDGFFMDGGEQVPFKWKFLKDFYSNIRLK